MKENEENSVKTLTHTGVTTGTLQELGCGKWRETS